MKVLMIGSFTLPALAHLDLEQEYAPLGGETILRAANGRAIRQESALAEKLSIRTSADGWIPSGLQTLDYLAQHVMRCIRPELCPADGLRQASLPAGKFRTDAGHVPWGFAEMANGQTVRSAVSLAGAVATVSAVAGAVRYHVGYYPQLTVYLMRPTRRAYSWELLAEEV